MVWWGFRDSFSSFSSLDYLYVVFFSVDKSTIVTKRNPFIEESKHFSLILSKKQMTSLLVIIVLVLLAVALWQ
jgi:hypothetical protein